MTNTILSRRVPGFAAVAAPIALAVLVVLGGPDAVNGQSAPVAGRSDVRNLFAGDRPLEVGLEMAEADWNRLRAEGRSLPQVFAGCLAPDFAYSRAAAQVSIDGERVSDVSARKKGFLGSLSVVRPSLRLDFGRGDHDGRTFHGTREITLNNNHQDRSNAKQCVTYELFSQAGLPAPRCGLAHVSVNGVDKGFFTNVEPIGSPLLRRAFGTDTGNLYELTVADFTPEMKRGFELKNNARAADRSDLDRVERALAAPDDRLVEALGAVVNLDRFMTFWAMEVLTGHWDGMTGNRNNTFLYHNPADDRFHAIPWGTDGSFQPNPLTPTAPTSVFTTNTISARLYAHPATRRMYHERLRALLGTVWNEDRIVARLRAIVAQTSGNAATLTATEAFVRGRRAAIEMELAGNAGAGPAPSTRPVEPFGCREPARASGAIDFTWNDTPTAFGPVKDLDALRLEMPLPGGAVTFTPGQVAQLATISAEGVVQLGLAGLDVTRGAPVFVGILMPPELYRVGDVAFHGVETYGVIVQLGGAGGARPLALIGGGTVTFTEAGRRNTDPVRGRWEGHIVPLTPGGP